MKRNANCQYVIKDAHGKAVLARDRIPSYTYWAREVLTINAALPVTVWAHHTIHGTTWYDGGRTRKLSDAIVALRRAVQS
jgi:hypothetical protein